LSGNTATLTLPAGGLAEDIYRLRILDSTILGLPDGAALDGDGNNLAGGEFRSDFVVGAVTTTLTSPNGFTFVQSLAASVRGN
jgi:hypothetical protein